LGPLDEHRLIKFGVPNVRFLPKDGQISSLGTQTSKLHQKRTSTHMRILSRWWQIALGVDLLEGRPDFPEAS
jgi:hypothetical protein